MAVCKIPFSHYAMGRFCFACWQQADEVVELAPCAGVEWHREDERRTRDEHAAELVEHRAVVFEVLDDVEGGDDREKTVTERQVASVAHS